MIDPMLSLSFSVYSNKGAYALLLGSGLSSSAGIPTGWAVMHDLIKQIAKLKKYTLNEDPVSWFEKTFEQEARYDNIIAALAKTPADRQGLLKHYFEPTEGEREKNLKVPQKAHKAIAKLVAGGYVRVILTTNFDRLLEKALEEEGIHPTVISKAEDIKGSLPLVHTECNVIKVNGDYLDTRFRNTTVELATYPSAVNKLIDRVLDEYGLIISGWSADWDVALRTRLEQCPNYRFTTYWTSRANLSELAQKTAQSRRAEIVNIQSADQFFEELIDQLSSLDEFARPHPLSVQTATATLKRLLADPRDRIKLHDFIRTETERVYAELSDENYPIQNQTIDGEYLANRLKSYESRIEMLQAISILGAYWGDSSQQEHWTYIIDRIGNPQGERSGNTLLINLRWYPALVLLYSAGIAAIASKSYHNLAAITSKPRNRIEGDDPLLIFRLNTPGVMRSEHGHLLPGHDQQYTPVSEHLFAVLREPLRELIPDDQQYEEYFDQFEYMLALIYTDHDLQADGKTPWGPVGRFGWKFNSRRSGKLPIDIIEELTKYGAAWPPLKAGLFGGDIERLKLVHFRFHDFFKSAVSGWH